jgi:hypothetical protein
MSPEFIEANRDALDEAEFERFVNPIDPYASIAQAAMYIGQGLAWFGFWICIGLCFGAFK